MPAVILAFLFVFALGLVSGCFISFGINNFLEGVQMNNLKLPLFTARINGAAIFSAPVLFRDEAEAEQMIKDALADMDKDAKIEELRLVGYFDPLNGTLEVLKDEKKTFEEDVE